MNTHKKVNIVFAKLPFISSETLKSTFSMIEKKSELEGDFEFLHSIPNFSKILNPQEKFSDKLILTLIAG